MTNNQIFVEKLVPMEFISKELDSYVCSHTEEEPRLLADLNRDTHLNVLKPRMLSGHFQGRVLSMLSHMIKPKDILEIGTYTGYSALCLAEGLIEGGHLLTIDNNEELQEMVAKYIDKSGRGEQIKQIIGNAQDIIPELKRQFDIVFIDADKSNYIMYYNQVFDKVRAGGYFIFDNVLWSGKVIDNSTDQDTQTLRQLNTLIHQDSRVQEVLLPIRDGLLIARKL